MAWLRRPEMEERRERRCSAPVLARIKGERDGFRRVEDIAAGGFRMMTKLALEHDARLPVRLRFPDLWEEIEIEARVAWSDTTGQAGFDLSEVDEDEAKLLGVMIAHQEVLGRMAGEGQRL